MSKQNATAGTPATLIGGGLGLIYFKPAGTLIRQDTFLDKLLASPITLEVEYRFEPEFSDLAPVPNLRVDTELRLSVAFNLEDEDGLLGDDAEQAEVGLFRVDTSPVKSFTLVHEAEAETETATENSDGVPGVVNFVTTSQVLANMSHTDTIDSNRALQLLALKDPSSDEQMRSEAWFDKLGDYIGKYARTTSFILEAGESTIVEPGAEEAAVSPPPATARPNPLRVNLDDDAPASPARVTPSVTREQLEQKRESRQAWMDEIRKTFRINHRLVYRVPLSQLADHPEVETIVNELVAQSGEPFDVFLQRNVRELVESAIVQIG